MIILNKQFFNSMNLLILLLCATVKLAIADSQQLKATSQPASKLKNLAELVCHSLSIQNMVPRSVCETNWNKNIEANVSTEPSSLQVKCYRKYTITFEITPSKNWQLVVLIPDDFEDNEPYKIEHILVKPNTTYEEIRKIPYLNYTIWSATINDDWKAYGWRSHAIVPAYDENMVPGHKEYKVNMYFARLIQHKEGNLVSGEFMWNTTDDTDLCFDFVNICDKSELEVTKIWPNKNPRVTLNGLPLNDKCQMHITGLYGTTIIHYSTPSCSEYMDCKYDDLVPEIPENVSLTATEMARGGWMVRVGWSRPRLQPQSYNVTLRVDAVRSDAVRSDAVRSDAVRSDAVRSDAVRPNAELTDTEWTVVLSGNATEAMFEDVIGEGFYNVSVYATIGRRSAHTMRLNLFPTRRVATLDLAWVLVSGAVGVWGAGALVAAALCWRRRWRTRRTSNSSLDEEEKLSRENEAEMSGIECASGEDHWEVRSDRVLLHEVIGEGAFGVVRRGTLAPGGKEVAVKMLKDFPSQEEIRSFRSEMELMKSVGAHPHVVSLVGCCSGRRPLIVAEYCSRGDLLSYLRCSWDVLVSKRYAKYYNNNTDRSDYRNDLFKCKLQSSPSEQSKLVVNKMYDLQGVCDSELTSLDLLSFCRQIAMGMSFLASNRVVHRDLAARNILVSGDRTLKIADFGLSRDVYEENQYKQKGNGKMPVKWMALESLTRRIYTSQSDVWSFGVVVWEIVTVGGSPYAEVPAARLVRLLRSGYRMPRPLNCSKQLYELMVSCWRAHPRDRPTFSELHERLDELLHSACADHYITLELDADDAPPTPRPQRYLHMLIRGRRPWTRGETYERPVNVNSNHYTSPPAILAKTQA